eukprot:CAMPEP_0181316574 /NCGR_PEP_ID=MMETSP1101-20121128/15969_1 /TAXON_ID=46948 /ORGANISM="Rhodomonas abbreviata, Strain Caron Lab Isolate" /LENGTH=527 /DNA_ID=CAMNT_0023423833 /DNA_START=6 /DNA_END=1585 /DNA_ORIENTATION=+
MSESMSILAKRRAKGVLRGGVNYAKLRLSVTKTSATERNSSTPKFLKDPKGIMIVSPVSPNNPLTPGKFFTEFIKNRGLNLISPKKFPRQKKSLKAVRSLKAAKDAIVAIQRLENSETVKQAAAERKQQTEEKGMVLQETLAEVRRVLSTCMETTEVVDWMSKVQKKQLLCRLEELSSFMPENLAGSRDNEWLRHGPDVLQIKSLVVQLNGKFSKLQKMVEAQEHSKNGHFRQRLERLEIEDVTRCSFVANDVDNVFKEAAIFAPVHALKTLDDGKRAFGKAMLNTLGVTGLQIRAKELDLKLLELFSEVDIDNSGDIDLEEMRKLFDRMGVTLSEESLGGMFKEHDKNNKGRLNFDDWKALIIPILTRNKVQVMQERLLTPETPEEEQIQLRVAAEVPAEDRAAAAERESVTHKPQNLFVNTNLLTEETVVHSTRSLRPLFLKSRISSSERQAISPYNLNLSSPRYTPREVVVQSTTTTDPHPPTRTASSPHASDASHSTPSLMAEPLATTDSRPRSRPPGVKEGG